jgi:hypothetical protein
MATPEGLPGRSELADDLRRHLAALLLCQRRWLADLAETCPDDGPGNPAFADALRRWQEQLAQLRLHLHRADHRLLHLAMAPGPRDGSEPPAPAPGPDWRPRIERWADRLHLPTAYRRLGHVLDPDAEAVTADITTDLAALALLAWECAASCDQLLRVADPGRLEAGAFWRVVAPWRTRGLGALGDVQRWLAEVLDDEGEW